MNDLKMNKFHTVLASVARVSLPLMTTAFLFLITSCDKNQDIDPQYPGSDPQPSSPVVAMQFTATTDRGTDESDANSKAALSTTAGNLKAIHWTADDAIGVYAYNGEWGNELYPFTLSSGAGTGKGTFSGSAPKADCYTALYPCQDEAWSETDGIVSDVVLPSVQHATAQSFDPQAALMMAVVTGTDHVLPFRNVCSYFSVTPRFDCTAISIESVNGEALTGVFNLNYNDGEPSYTITGGVSKVTLAGNLKAGNCYYLAVLPVSLSGGFSVCYETANSSTRRKSGSQRTLLRSEYYDISASCPEMPSTSLKYVDLGLPSGLLWATCNIGARSEENAGDYFAWGETAPKATYRWNNYLYGDGSEHNPVTSTFVTKYQSADGLSTLQAQDDAATVNWGPAWRTPTRSEWEELLDPANCSWTYQDNYQGTGVKGVLVTSLRSGYESSQIFLPYAGYRTTGIYGAAIRGSYLSATVQTDACYSQSAGLLIRQNADGETHSYSTVSADRFIGQTVRAVRDRD